MLQEGEKKKRERILRVSEPVTHENGLAVKVLLCEEPYACLNGFYVDL